MLSGEGLQSALAFGLNIALARTISARSYGEFAIIVLISALEIGRASCRERVCCKV